MGRDGDNGTLFIVQARPEAFESQKKDAVIEVGAIAAGGVALASGGARWARRAEAAVVPVSLPSACA